MHTESTCYIPVDGGNVRVLALEVRVELVLGAGGERLRKVRHRTLSALGHTHDRLSDGAEDGLDLLVGPNDVLVDGA